MIKHHQTISYQIFKLAFFDTNFFKHFFYIGSLFDLSLYILMFFLFEQFTNVFNFILKFLLY